jgi:hypothetical protein
MEFYDAKSKKNIYISAKFCKCTEFHLQTTLWGMYSYSFSEATGWAAWRERKEQ